MCAISVNHARSLGCQHGRPVTRADESAKYVQRASGESGHAAPVETQCHTPHTVGPCATGQASIAIVRCAAIAARPPLASREKLQCVPSIQRTRTKTRMRRAVQEVRTYIAARKRRAAQNTRPTPFVPTCQKTTRRSNTMTADQEKKRKTLEPAAVATVVAPSRPATTQVLQQYACPYCNQCVGSSRTEGTITVGGHCGRQFRVRRGVVVRMHVHRCPVCETEVQSSKPCGKIQVQHKDANGKACRKASWVVRLDSVPAAKQRDSV